MTTNLSNPVIAEIGIKLAFADQYLNAKNELKVNFKRFKKSTPFSERLNQWLREWYHQNENQIHFVEIDPVENYKSMSEYYKEMKKSFDETGHVIIWTGASDNTIFGEPHINHIFRAWHDMTHYYYNQPFNFGGESTVATIQCSELPTDWIFERELITAEVLGQNQYYRIHREYVVDQRQFAYDYLFNTVEALTVKQNNNSKELSSVKIKFIDLRKQKPIDLI